MPLPENTRKFMVIRGQHRQCVTTELEFNVYQVIFVPPTVTDLPAYFEQYAKDHGKWSAEELYHHTRVLKFDGNNIPWCTIDVYSHPFNRRYFGFIPAQCFMAAFDPEAKLAA